MSDTEDFRLPFYTATTIPITDFEDDADSFIPRSSSHKAEAVEEVLAKRKRESSPQHISKATPKKRSTASQPRSSKASTPNKTPLKAGPETTGTIFEVDHIVDDKRVGKTTYYRIRWKGYTPKDDTWEPEANILTPIVLREYNLKKAARTPTKKKSTSKPATDPITYKEQLERRNAAKLEAEMARDSARLIRGMRREEWKADLSWGLVAETGRRRSSKIKSEFKEEADSPPAQSQQRSARQSGFPLSVSEIKREDLEAENRNEDESDYEQSREKVTRDQGLSTQESNYSLIRPPVVDMERAESSPEILASQEMRSKPLPPLTLDDSSDEEGEQPRDTTENGNVRNVVDDEDDSGEIDLNAADSD